MIYSQK